MITDRDYNLLVFNMDSHAEFLAKNEANPAQLAMRIARIVKEIDDSIEKIPAEKRNGFTAIKQAIQANSGINNVIAKIKEVCVSVAPKSKPSQAVYNPSAEKSTMVIDLLDKNDVEAVKKELSQLDMSKRSVLISAVGGKLKAQNKIGAIEILLEMATNSDLALTRFVENQLRGYAGKVFLSQKPNSAGAISPPSGAKVAFATAATVTPPKVEPTKKVADTKKDEGKDEETVSEIEKALKDNDRNRAIKFLKHIYDVNLLEKGAALIAKSFSKSDDVTAFLAEIKNSQVKAKIEKMLALNSQVKAETEAFDSTLATLNELLGDLKPNPKVVALLQNTLNKL